MCYEDKFTINGDKFTFSGEQKKIYPIKHRTLHLANAQNIVHVLKKEIYG